jgi:predicted MFS family arabinose efflux permease
LQSARGIGAVIGALVIAVLGRSGVRGKLFTLGSFVFPALLVVLTFTRTLSASLCVLVGVGFGVMVLLNISNSMVQTQVPDDMRGRVMSIYTLTFFGTLPIGALIVGTLATHINEPAAVIVGALIVFCASIWILWRVPELRAME